MELERQLHHILDDALPHLAHFLGMEQQRVDSSVLVLYRHGMIIAVDGSDSNSWCVDKLAEDEVGAKSGEL